MSHWTAVLITAGVVEDTAPDITGHETPTFPAVDFVNDWLAANHQGALFHVQNPDPLRQCPESVFAGHFKSLDIDGFKSAVEAAPWVWREVVQLFIRDEHDDRFAEHPFRSET